MMKCFLPFVLARGAHFILLYFDRPQVWGRVRLCLIRFPMHENWLEQHWHKYGLIPVWSDECVTKLSRCAKDFSHTFERKCEQDYFILRIKEMINIASSITLHLYGFSFVWLRSWILSCPLLKKLLPQKLHRCFFSPVWMSMWAFNVNCVINFELHWLHV